MCRMIFTRAAAFLLSLFISSNCLFAQTTQVFSSSGTFTVPACVTSFTVQCWGAGGGGGGASEATGGATGSGGGGGGFATGTFNNVSGTYTVVVGAGGTGGVGTANTGPNGTAGGSSFVTNGTDSVVGVGGGGGPGSAGGVASTVGHGGGARFTGVTTTSSYTGGNGAMGNNADNNTGGAGGGGAGNDGDGTTPATTGRDANATGGTGGAGIPNTAQYYGGAGGGVTAAYYENGDPGTTIGGGGGGGGGETSGGLFGHGTEPGTGGAGGNGEVIITYTPSTPTITSVSGGGCTGTTITIDGTLLTGATSVTIGSTAVTGLTITSTVITGTIAAGTSTGTVKVITPCGTATSASPFTVYTTPGPVNLGTVSLCSGSYNLGGHIYSSPGTYTDTITNAHGCDSISTVTLTGGSTIHQSISQSLCGGGSYNFGGNSYDSSGVYSDTAVAVSGCDSITTLTLSITQALYHLTAQSICAGTSYSFNGVNYSAAGTYADTLIGAGTNGCDSVTALALAVMPVPYHLLNQAICAGTSYNFNGVNYSIAGTYADTLIGAASNGCDSISALVLLVNPAATSLNHDSICFGTSYTFNGRVLTSPGTYFDTISGGAANGCDSTITLMLALKTNSGTPVMVTATDTEFCPGDSVQLCATAGFVSYNWSTGQTSDCFYTTFTGPYDVTATDVNGCTANSDQVNLSNYPTTPVTINQSGDTLSSYSAKAYQWEFNDTAIQGDTMRSIVATQSGQYSVLITDSNGCHYKSSDVKITTGISLIGKGEEIRVFPNPLSGGNWNVLVSNNLAGGEMELFDATGQLLFQSRIVNPNTQIPVSTAPAGVYELRITSGEQNYTLKLVKLN